MECSYGSHNSTDVLIYSTPWSWHHSRISSASMFHAKSISTSPAERYSPSSVPMFSRVTRLCAKLTPRLIHGASIALRSSKSMTVMFLAGVLMCLTRIGRAHCATAPYPTNRILFLNGSIKFEAQLCRNFSGDTRNYSEFGKSIVLLLVLVLVLGSESAKIRGRGRRREQIGRASC